MNGYEPEAWFEFGVGIIGAAAALAGLLFVAMSINIERILALPKLPSRAGGNVVLFVLPLLLGIWLLVPGQGTTALGLEVLAMGLVCGGLLLWLIRPSNRVLAARQPAAERRAHSTDRRRGDHIDHRARRRALLASASRGHRLRDRPVGCVGAAGRDPPLNERDAVPVG